MNEFPAEGGSYIRNADGSVTKVAEQEQQPAAASEPTPAENGDAQPDDAAKKVK